MASIQRPKGSKYFYAHFRIPKDLDPTTGKVLSWKQVKRSTGQAERGKAERAAVEMEESLRQQAGAGTERSQRLLSILQRATTIAVQGRLSELVARRMLAELYSEATGSELAFYTVETWLAEWLRRKESKVKKSTHYLYRQAAREFLAWLGSRSQERLESISKDEILRFLEQVPTKGRTAKTANQFKKSLFNAFKAAAQAGLLIQNPVDGIQDLPEDDSTSRLPFTLEEVKRLCSVANPEWTGMVLLGAYAGMRLRDASRLCWKSVDLENGELQFEPMKQRRSRKKKLVLRVKMHRALKDALLKLPSSDDLNAPVFSSLSRKQTGGNGGLTSTFSKLMDKAGIDPLPTRKREDGAARTVTQKSFHSLRHFCNSAMADAGVPQEIRRQIVGHASDEINDIYTHWKADKLAEAIDLIPD